MSMMQQQATRDNRQTTLGEYDREIPNTEPTNAAYTTTKAKLYSTTRRIKKGSTGSTDTTNKWYNKHWMWKLHKTLKRTADLGPTALDA